MVWQNLWSKAWQGVSNSKHHENLEFVSLFSRRLLSSEVSVFGACFASPSHRFPLSFRAIVRMAKDYGDTSVKLGEMYLFTPPFYEKWNLRLCQLKECNIMFQLLLTILISLGRCCQGVASCDERSTKCM